MSKLIVTIDGPAGSGKSTMARLLAEKLGAAFLDTGAMYRAVTLAAMQSGVNMKNEEQLLSTLNCSDFKFAVKNNEMSVSIDGVDVTDNIRLPEVTEKVHYVASSSVLREKLVQMQRDFAVAHERIVTEGRDQGTVVFADADVKFFLIADIDKRAERRRAQFLFNGLDVPIEQLVKAIKTRDESDEKRSVGPLKPAPDAIIVDTTDLNIEEVIEKLVGYINYD